MKLAIDAAANRLEIDGRSVAGHHRWEAAAMSLLLDQGHRSPATACPAATLQSGLQSLGQLGPLNRKQISRLWDGVANMFCAAGATEAFRQRFGYPVRGRTVGPWWWAVLPGDTVSGDRSAPTRRAAFELPQLAHAATPTDMARLCQHAMLCRAMLVDGRFEEAEAALVDPAGWLFATTETLAFRHVTLVELHLHRRRFGEARRALDAASRVLARSAVADVYLRGTVRYLEHRLAYSRAPTRNHGRILAAIAPVIGRAPGAGYPEMDRRARGLTLNLASLCERRNLEQVVRRKGHDAARPHLVSALRYASAAIYGFMTSNQYENTQNVCSNVAYLLQRAFLLGVEQRPDAALEWYAVAQVLQNRFLLADNNVWEYIFLGDFWLHTPSVRPAFAAMAARVGWAGRRPDRLDFYEAAARGARDIGDARQRAHTLLNLCLFAREQQNAALAESASAELRAVVDADPEIGEILRSEGYVLPLPVPARGRVLVAGRSPILPAESGKPKRRLAKRLPSRRLRLPVQ